MHFVDYQKYSMKACHSVLMSSYPIERAFAENGLEIRAGMLKGSHRIADAAESADQTARTVFVQEQPYPVRYVEIHNVHIDCKGTLIDLAVEWLGQGARLDQVVVD